MTYPEFDTPRSEPEQAPREFTIGSRAPAIRTTRWDPLWPLKMHNERLRDAANGNLLPDLVSILSIPTEAASRPEVENIFARNPHNRQSPWRAEEGENGNYSFSSANHQTPGITYEFDANGRMVMVRHFSSSGIRSFQSIFKYDEAGYVTACSTWQNNLQVEEQFEYAFDNAGRKQPVGLTHSVTIGKRQSVPMHVNLADYENWIIENPDGFKPIDKEALEPSVLLIGDLEEAEHRTGIFFDDPAELEVALIRFGLGNFTYVVSDLRRYEDTTRNDFGDKILTTRQEAMERNVHRTIMQTIRHQWAEVNDASDPEEYKYVPLDFNQTRQLNFANAQGQIYITKAGIGLELKPAAAIGISEAQFAKAIGRERALDSLVLDLPINQTRDQDHFLLDIPSIAAAIDLDINQATIEQQLDHYIQFRARGKQDAYVSLVLGTKSDEGVRVELIIATRDIDTDTDLTRFFDSDSTSIWGPLPKNILHERQETYRVPRLRIGIDVRGNRYDDQNVRRTYQTAMAYIHRLEQWQERAAST